MTEESTTFEIQQLLGLSTRTFFPILVHWP